MLKLNFLPHDDTEISLSPELIKSATLMFLQNGLLINNCTAFNNEYFALTYHLKVHN